MTISAEGPFCIPAVPAKVLASAQRDVISHCHGLEDNNSMLDDTLFGLLVGLKAPTSAE